MKKAGRDCRYAPMKTEMMNKADVWNETEILKKREKKIWHIHPVKFKNYLDKVGLISNEKHIQDLIRAQDEIMSFECLQQGAKGKDGYDGFDSNQTYCNHAVYLTIWAVDKNYQKFIGFNNFYLRDNTPPWEEKMLTSILKNKIPKGSNGKYKYRNSTLWYEILEEQAKLGILVKLNEGADYKVWEKRAQEYANKGYVVIAAWRNLPGDDNHPHYATARPGFEYDSNEGTMLANVGSENGIVRVTIGFKGKKRDDINWYYNPNQIFQNEINSVLESYGIS